VRVESSAWSGDGALTARLVEFLEARPEVAFVRVEDAPSSRAEAGYNFLSNEIYVGFAVVERSERAFRLGFLPGVRRRRDASLTFAGLEPLLSEAEGIGPPDYADDGMIQYLRTERVVAPYQTRGVKVIEMVRLYPVGAAPQP
jgi:hypothetical protein